MLPLETHAAVALGRMYETPELRTFLTRWPGSKKTKTGADLMISAIAIVQGAVVVTNSDSDYLLIDRLFELPGLFNPLTNSWLIEPRNPEFDWHRVS